MPHLVANIPPIDVAQPLAREMTLMQQITANTECTAISTKIFVSFMDDLGLLFSAKLS
jgi:hypothetical protein